MKYLVYYFSLLDNQYHFRLCGEMQNAYDFSNDLLNNKVCYICYIYTLYGRRGCIRYEEKKRK